MIRHEGWRRTAQGAEARERFPCGASLGPGSQRQGTCARAPTHAPRPRAPRPPAASARAFAAPLAARAQGRPFAPWSDPFPFDTRGSYGRSAPSARRVPGEGFAPTFRARGLLRHVVPCDRLFSSRVTHHVACVGTRSSSGLGSIPLRDTTLRGPVVPSKDIWAPPPTPGSRAQHGAVWTLSLSPPRFIPLCNAGDKRAHSWGPWEDPMSCRGKARTWHAGGHAPLFLPGVYCTDQPSLPFTEHYRVPG